MWTKISLIKAEEGKGERFEREVAVLYELAYGKRDCECREL